MKKFLLLFIFPLILNSCSDEKDCARLPLSVSDNTIYFSVLGGTETLNITTEAEWWIDGDTEWFSLDRDKGTGDATVSIRAAANDRSTQTQQTVLTVRTSSSSKEVTLTQIGNVILNDYFDPEFLDHCINNLQLAQNGKDLYSLDIADVDEIFFSMRMPTDVVDLKGIEYFSALKELTCPQYMEKLDVSRNRNLEILSFMGSNLTEIDLSKNQKLKDLNCANNKLTELDLSRNTHLEVLSCANNQITELDLSNNQMLRDLNCNLNNIRSLDLTNNPHLESLAASGDELLKMDDPEKWAVSYLSALDLSANPKITTLNVSNSNIDKLETGNLTNLEILFVNGTLLKSLDVSSNKSLFLLFCYDTPLTEITIPAGHDIEEFIYDEGVVINKK